MLLWAGISAGCTGVPVQPGSRPPEPSTGLEKAFPPIVQPADNPVTLEKIELGRKLFFDPILSGDNTMSCAHCHHPDIGFSDGLALARGKGSSGVGPARSGGVELPRSAPTLWNALYNHRQFWDGRAADLESQARGPITSPDEMDEKPDRLLQELAAIPEYQRSFDQAFGGANGPTLQFENVLRAIASFERTLAGVSSRFDRYAAGDTTALDEAERRGLKLFLSPKTRCAECHGLPTFANRDMKVIGVPDAPDARDGPSRAFKIPTLRNVALTAPYMHNGSLKTLLDVLDFYSGGGGRGRGLEVQLQDDKIRKFSLTAEEKTDLVKFLESLTDVSTLPDVPARVPSGLPVVARLIHAAPVASRDHRDSGSHPAGALERKVVEAHPGESIQSAVDRGGRGAIVRVLPGFYRESILVIHHDVTITGVEENGVRPVLDGEGKLADGIAALGNRFEVRGLEIRNYQGNGVVVHKASDVVFEDLVLTKTGLYGLYPVECDGVRIERCKVSGTSDAGIYVGQSRGIVVRQNEAVANVAGIEIENSTDALVENNHVHDNTGGILVFVLPFNPSKVGQATRVVKNRVLHNNTPNFAAPGSTVANVLRGTGILVLGADDTVVADNEIGENESCGISVSGLIGLYPADTRFDVEPFSDRTRVHSNVLRANGLAPDERLEKLYKLPGRDLIWDGTGKDNAWLQPGATSYPETLPALRP